MNIYQIIETNQISSLSKDAMNETLFDTCDLPFCYIGDNVTSDELYAKSVFDYLIRIYGLELKSIYELRII